ncbi:hypothetical protein [Comamonas sp. F1-6]|uniref:hypothetical protein n=1 Tax=Comamonas sp. F1-6 TaxID=673550 RepID=UPI0031E30526
MNYASFMTQEEACALNSILMTEGQDEDLLAAMNCVSMVSRGAQCVHFAIRVLDSKSEPVNLIEVFEFIHKPTSLSRFPDVAPQMTLEVLTEMAMNVATKEWALEFFDQRCQAMCPPELGLEDFGL